MKKRIIALALALVLAVALCGCGCEHEWQEATCLMPEYCMLCGETQGKALSPEGHSWIEATTESPITCERCGITAGERIIVDERFRTEDCAQLFGTWHVTAPMPVTTGESVSDEEVLMENYYYFSNDGNFIMTEGYVDPEDALEKFLALAIEEMYIQLEGQGYTRQQVDAELGGSPREYMESSGQLQQYKKMFTDNTKSYLKYYVEDGKLYLGGNWQTEFMSLDFKLEGDELFVDQDPPLKRVG